MSAATQTTIRLTRQDLYRLQVQELRAKAYRRRIAVRDELAAIAELDREADELEMVANGLSRSNGDDE